MCARSPDSGARAGSAFDSLYPKPWNHKIQAVLTMTFLSFGDGNQGNEMGINYGKINLHPSRSTPETEEGSQRKLADKDKTLGPDHTSTLDTVSKLGRLYFVTGKPKGEEKMYQQALAGYEEALDEDDMCTLNTVHNLGILYSDQGKLKEAEEMYQEHSRAMRSPHV